VAQRLREKEILGEGLQRPSEYGWMEERNSPCESISEAPVPKVGLSRGAYKKGLIQYIYLLTPGSPQNQGLQRFGCRGKCTCGKILAGQPQENCEFFSCYCVSPFRLGTLL